MRHKVVYMHVNLTIVAERNPENNKYDREFFEKWWNVTIVLLGVERPNLLNLLNLVISNFFNKPLKLTVIQ